MKLQNKLQHKERSKLLTYSYTSKGQYKRYYNINKINANIK